MAEDNPNRLVFQHRTLEELKRELKNPDKLKRETAETLIYTRYKTAETPEERKQAGKILGYSGLRIRTSEYLRKFFR
jgi:hypothetical protein